MKDYYYILGITSNASPEEVRRSYRKLSFKFHPDTNQGDEFFSHQFRQIKEAYEILIDPVRRRRYDYAVAESLRHRENRGENFSPVIVLFKASSDSFKYNERVTFSWKTINANKVLLKPFGGVEPIGEKTYVIKDFKHPLLTFEILAENTAIEKKETLSITLRNDTYHELYHYFQGIVKNETSVDEQTQGANKDKQVISKITENYQHTTSEWIFVIAIIICVVILLINL